MIGVYANPLITLRKKFSSQPARLSFMERDPLDVSLRMTSSALRRRTAMLLDPVSFRLHAASSTEGYIELPMQRIIDGPVNPHGGAQDLWLGDP